MFTTETVNGALFLKWRGITRFIWMPRKGNGPAFAAAGGILVLGLFGYCAVFAPLVPNRRRSA